MTSGGTVAGYRPPRAPSLGALATAVALLLALTWASAARAEDGEDATPVESSDAYLRNVVDELKLMHGFDRRTEVVAAAAAAETSLMPAETHNRHHQTYEETSAPGAPIVELQTPQIPRHDLRAQHQHQVSINDPTSLTDEPSAAVVAGAGPSAPPLGFTPAELASMYRQAIERGVPVRQESLASAISYQTPKIVVSGVGGGGGGGGGGYHRYEPEATNHHRPHYGPAGESPQYAYYFYPLKTFRHELAAPHGYRTPDIKFDSTPAMNIKTETNSMNPVLVGISSFLGTAIVFLISMFLYPRFMNYMHFPFLRNARASLENDLIPLMTIVTESIDYYYSRKAQKVSEYPLSIRKKKRFKRY